MLFWPKTQSKVESRKSHNTKNDLKFTRAFWVFKISRYTDKIIPDFQSSNNFVEMFGFDGYNDH